MVKNMYYKLSNNQNQNPISLGLTDLFAYSLKVGHAVEKIKIIYNLEKQNCLVDSKLSNRVEMTEISSSLMEQVDYLINSLIDSYLMVYNSTLLSKITFEANLDELGIVYDSIVISCFMRTNIPSLHLNSWDILSRALISTVNAERSEIIERPATNLTINLKRKKLRNVSIIFDYSKDQDDQVFKSAFSQGFFSTLRVIVADYCKFQGTHQASMCFNFDLLSREQLKLKTGNVYPTKKLSTYDGHFSANEAKYLLLQLNQAMSLITGSKVSGLQVTRHPNGGYMTMFSLVGAKNTSASLKNAIDITVESSNGLANVLTQVVNTYALPELYKQWINKISVTLTLSEGHWLIRFKKYIIEHRFDNQKVSLSSAKMLLRNMQATINDRAKISGFTVITAHNLLKEMQVNIAELQSSHEFEQPMVINLNTNYFNNGKLYFNFANSDQGYYLKSERYLGWSEI
ncbi:hypothetical protein GSR61_11340 (plasmid) [Lactobacillus crispatus]|uniref:Uncharacterized protein n=1 Tax=Lactobacillus crispatus TaxID=47770 RepID=A0AB37DJV8_9LACO|nr:hypothetical protein [Lactobacillus crispatus]QHQ69171.1 hypothetical protein GSR61_11340 [Lactobacillus crispatus]